MAVPIKKVWLVGGQEGFFDALAWWILILKYPHTPTFEYAQNHLDQCLLNYLTEPTHPQSKLFILEQLASALSLFTQSSEFESVSQTTNKSI